MNAWLPNRRAVFQTLLFGGTASGYFLRPPEALSADDVIDPKKLPPKVLAAADKAVPGAKWTAASKDEEDGEVIYELEGTDRKGRNVTVEVTAAGVVEEVSTEIPPKEVPKAVMAALKAKLPRFKATTITELRQGGVVDGYEFDGKRPKDKEEINVYVSADGKTVEIDED